MKSEFPVLSESSLAMFNPANQFVLELEWINQFHQFQPHGKAFKNAIWSLTEILNPQSADTLCLS